MPTIQTAPYEMIESRNGGGDISTGDAFETRKYKMQYTDTSANSVDARNETGVPPYGDQLGSHEMYVMNKDAATDPKDQRWWVATITYRTLKAFDQQPNFDNATKWNIIKSIVPYPYEVPLQKDKNDKPIVNVLGEPIRPALTRVQYDLQVNVSFLTDVVDATTINSCLGSANDSSVSLTIGGVVWTFNTNTLLFQSATIQEVYDADGNLIAQVAFQFLFRRDTWQQLVPNLSFYTCNDTTAIFTTLIPILDYNKQPVNEPRYLDSLGHQLAAGVAITTNPFDTVELADFDTLLTDIV